MHVITHVVVGGVFRRLRRTSIRLSLLVRFLYLKEPTLPHGGVSFRPPRKAARHRSPVAGRRTVYLQLLNRSRLSAKVRIGKSSPINARPTRRQTDSLSVSRCLRWAAVPRRALRRSVPSVNSRARVHASFSALSFFAIVALHGLSDTHGAAYVQTTYKDFFFLFLFFGADRDLSQAALFLLGRDHVRFQ